MTGTGWMLNVVSAQSAGTLTIERKKSRVLLSTSQGKILLLRVCFFKGLLMEFIWFQLSLTCYKKNLIVIHEEYESVKLVFLCISAFVLSCASPLTPDNGDISATSLQVGGVAYFFCLNGYQLQGPASLTCRNSSTPYWSGREPTCQGMRPPNPEVRFYFKAVFLSFASRILHVRSFI